MDVEICETAIGFAVLLAEILQEPALAAAGDPDRRELRLAALVAHRYVALGNFAVHDPESQVDAPPFFVPCSALPSSEAVRESCDELFEEVCHVRFCGPWRATTSCESGH